MRRSIRERSSFRFGTPVSKVNFSGRLSLRVDNYFVLSPIAREREGGGRSKLGECRLGSLREEELTSQGVHSYALGEHTAGFGGIVHQECY
ncbi:hypothetical protein R1flu_028949 [Riccia fluitans]|uniref:Uncharacterized protein n=1 Tax=Riccia fluitans TaxID=41844 RepID=A0ABD1XR45_9MARC